MRVICVTMCFIVLTLAGCSRNEPDQHLIDIAVRLEKNAASIQELSLAVEGINSRLASIEDSVRRLVQIPSPHPHLERGPISASDDTAFKDISRQIAVLTQELALTKNELSSVKLALEKVVLNPKDVGKALHQLLDRPEEFVKGLDMFRGSVSARIEDPATRQNFEADIARLREEAIRGYSGDELYEDLRARFLEKLNLVTDQKDRQQIESEILKLETCSEDERRERLAEYRRDLIYDQLMRIVKVYGLKKEYLIQFLAASPPE